MKNSIKSNAWTKDKLVELKICYEARVPIKLMAQVFNKSETSISKILTRSNIRPLGSQPRGVRPRTLRRCFTTKEEVIDLLSKARQYPAQSPQSLCYYLCDQEASQNRRRQLKRVRQKPIESWTSLSHLIYELQQDGKNISPTYNLTLLRQGFEYVVNGSPTKCADLLRIVNTERAAMKLPRIFIEGITDNC